MEQNKKMEKKKFWPQILSRGAFSNFYIIPKMAFIVSGDNEYEQLGDKNNCSLPTL